MDFVGGAGGVCESARDVVGDGADCFDCLDGADGGGRQGQRVESKASTFVGAEVVAIVDGHDDKSG